jgi:hypothetical protein
MLDEPWFRMTKKSSAWFSEQTATLVPPLAMGVPAVLLEPSIADRAARFVRDDDPVPGFVHEASGGPGVDRDR